MTANRASSSGEFRIGVSIPATWKIEATAPAVGAEASGEQTKGLSVTSPNGSELLVAPYGLPGFGIDPEVASAYRSIWIDGLAATRTDYSDPGSGSLLFIIIRVETSPKYTSLEIFLRPSKTVPDEREMLERLLNSIDMP